MNKVAPVRKILEGVLSPVSKGPVKAATGYKFVDGGKVLAEHRCSVNGNFNRTKSALADFKERAELLHGLNVSVHAEKSGSGVEVTAWHPVRVPREFEHDVEGLCRLKKSVRTLEGDVVSSLKKYEKKR
ncbi:MAG: hypothetical protein WCX64_01040 [Candidatus Micrarchaeia archaeon]